MELFGEICILCLVGKNNIQSILSSDDDGIIVEEKLKYIFSELINFKPEIPKNICIECLENLNHMYKFKQKCTQNLISLYNYVKDMTTENKQSVIAETQCLFTQKNRITNEVNVDIKMEEITVSDSDEDVTIKVEQEEINDDASMQCGSLTSYETQTERSTDKLANNEGEDNYCVVTGEEVYLTDNFEDTSTSTVSDESNEVSHKYYPTHHHSHSSKKPSISDEIVIKHEPLLPEQSCTEDTEEDTLQDESANNAESLADPEFMEYKGILPEKSKRIYVKVYNGLKDWCLTKNITDISEAVLLEYFQEQALQKKASSLWSIYSMLKSTLYLKEKLDIAKYLKLFEFLKRQNSLHKPKKSSVFSKEEITKFLMEAPDDRFLSTKATPPCQIPIMEASAEVMEWTDDDCTPPNVQAAKESTLNLLPIKSRERYEFTYNQFMKWHEETNDESSFSEQVLLAYFGEQSKKVSPNSLWTVYSMLKSTLNIKQDIDIAQYVRLKAFLKRMSDGYKPKKAKTLTAQEIHKFLNEAPDDKYLLSKAIFVIAVAGACRTDELCNMLMTDIDMRNDLIIINIPNSKAGTSRKFVMVEPLWIDVVKKYLSKRPSPDLPKVFIGLRHGKPMRQNVGHNTISRVPKTVATFLKLKNLSNYTGFSMRLTSANISAKCDGPVL